MLKIYPLITLIIILLCNGLQAQNLNDTTTFNTQQIPEISITGVKSIKGMGYLDEVNSGIVYSGKKTEVLLIDSIDANTAQSNPRQVMGRIPGAVFSETLGSGFPSNGVGFRGLNPTQSIETNTRMNSYNITADIYGYPEAYFIPPLEAVQRIEVIRGASSLQFGPQFGGVINYIIQDAPNKPFAFASQQTVGSYGLFNSFNSISGKYKWFSYYGFFQYQTVQGWRPNSDYHQLSGFGKIQFQPIDKLKFSFEYSALRNRIHMPGGLSDEQYYENARSSFRVRNWLASPWNIGAFKLQYDIKPGMSVHLTSSLLSSSRYLVWRNEDGGPQELDEIDPATNMYVNREVERETFLSTTNELRFLAGYHLGKTENTVAVGIRGVYAKMHRQEGGLGTTGTDFDMTLLDPNYENDLRFTTTNIAPFIENIFRVTKKFSITPGFRFEFINSTVDGYITDEDGNIVTSSKSKKRFIPLAGIGLQYKTTNTTEVYANWSQAYRPVDYSQLSPIGTTSVIDPKMKDANGFNADLGFRGTVKNYLSFDVSGFLLQYNNRIGLTRKVIATTDTVDFRTNIANSRHVGIETYIEFNPVKLLTPQVKYGSISFYNSFTYVDARYVNGAYKNNLVENAPHVIERLGITYAISGLSVTFLTSYTSSCFSDADNTVFSENATVGKVPSYVVFDLSATYKFLKRMNIKAGVNNLADKHYFTKRTDEYPGPGIIPSIGRSFYVGIGINL